MGGQDRSEAIFLISAIREIRGFASENLSGTPAIFQFRAACAHFRSLCINCTFTHGCCQFPVQVVDKNGNTSHARPSRARHIQRASHGQRSQVGHVRVDHCRFDVLVAEQLWHGANVVAGFEQVRGERMSQRAAAHALVDLGLADCLANVVRNASNSRSPRSAGCCHWPVRSLWCRTYSSTHRQSTCSVDLAKCWSRQAAWTSASHFMMQLGPREFASALGPPIHRNPLHLGSLTVDSHQADSEDIASASAIINSSAAAVEES